MKIYTGKYKTLKQFQQKVNDWAGILDDPTLGPFFFAATLTGEGFLAMFHPNEK